MIRNRCSQGDIMGLLRTFWVVRGTIITVRAYHKQQCATLHEITFEAFFDDPPRCVDIQSGQNLET